MLLQLRLDLQLTFSMDELVSLVHELVTLGPASPAEVDFQGCASMFRQTCWHTLQFEGQQAWTVPSEASDAEMELGETGETWETRASAGEPLGDMCATAAWSRAEEVESEEDTPLSWLRVSEDSDHSS